MMRRRALLDAQEQLLSGTCLTELLRARANLQAMRPDCPVVALLDDKIAHLRARAARDRMPARRPDPAFPSL